MKFVLLGMVIMSLVPSVAVPAVLVLSLFFYALYAFGEAVRPLLDDLSDSPNTAVAVEPGLTVLMAGRG